MRTILRFPPLLAKGIVNHLPATTSEKFKQALAQARAAAAVKYGFSEAATNIILDVFGTTRPLGRRLSSTSSENGRDA
jgi:hypothetical protein